MLDTVHLNTAFAAVADGVFRIRRTVAPGFPCIGSILKFRIFRRRKSIPADFPSESMIYTTIPGAGTACRPLNPLDYWRGKCGKIYRLRHRRQTRPAGDEAEEAGRQSVAGEQLGWHALF